MILFRHRSAMRRLLFGTLVCLVVLAAAHTGLWWLATARLQDNLTAWQAQRRAAGWTTSTGPPARAGWPLAAAIELPDPAIAGGEADLPHGLAWRAEHAELSVALLRPLSLRIRVAGQQHLRLATLPEFGFTADRFELTVPLAPGLPSRAIDLAAVGLRAALSTGPLDIATLALRADTRLASEAALAVTGSAEAIRLPPLRSGRPWPTGPRIASVSFEGGLTRAWPESGTLAARAATWRDAGGTLEVRRLVLGWGPLGLAASATLAFDPRLQPMGDATARLVGYDTTLDALASSGVLPSRAVQAVEGVLAILVRPPEDGSAPQIELPLTLHDRALAVGPFPLLRLREWVWP
jgi:hypothetical protein